MLLAGTSQEKFYDFRKSLTHFGALISDQHFSQVSLRSDKSAYPINSFEQRYFTQKNPRVFDLERNLQFSHLTEAVVNVAMPPTNETQLRTPSESRKRLSGIAFSTGVVDEPGAPGEPSADIYTVKENEACLLY